MTDTQRLSVADHAPTFSLESDTGRSVSLSDYSGSSVILYFYPAASTPGCTKQACDFRDNLTLLQSTGYSVVGISPDPVAKLAKFRDSQDLTFPLLSDPTKDTLRSYGAFGLKSLYGKQVEGVIRSTFMVDGQGIIRLAQYNVKATGHVAKLLRDLQV